jgi:hypothetical protein
MSEIHEVMQGPFVLKKAKALVIESLLKSSVFKYMQVCATANDCFFAAEGKTDSLLSGVSNFSQQIRQIH